MILQGIDVFNYLYFLNNQNQKFYVNKLEFKINSFEFKTVKIMIEKLIMMIKKIKKKKIKKMKVILIIKLFLMNDLWLNIYLFLLKKDKN